MASERVAQRVQATTIIVHWDADDLEAVVAKDFEREKLRGLFHEDDVAGPGKPRTHEIQCLRNTGRHHELHHTYRRPIPAREKTCERFTNFHVALIGTILQQCRISSPQTMIGRRTQGFCGKQ